ncbi:MAG: Hsp33 family molecular chaperone HslO [Alkalispirochaeta sp.]
MKQQPLRDKVLEEHLQSIAGDGTDTYLLAEGTVRAAVVHGTALVNRMQVNHHLSGTGALILGQAYLLALLAASTLKDEDRLSVVVDCTGPVEGLSVEANSHGQVRGYLHNSEVRLSEVGSVEDVFGTGTLTMIRVGADMQHPFQGQTQWHRGDLAQNVAWYYANSEQTATLVDVNIHFDEDKRIRGAAAILVQAMPGASPGVLQEVGDSLKPARPLGQVFASGATAAQLVQRHLAAWSPELIGTRAAEFYCSCSHERFGRFLAALPEDEQRDILENGPIPVKTTCHNCNSTYRFERDELVQLFSGAAPSQS